MRPLQLDWLHPDRKPRAWRWLSAGVLCIGLAGAAFELAGLMEANAGIAGAEDELRRLRGMALRGGAGVEAGRQGEKTADDVRQRLALPWDRLFLDLEAATVEGVALSNLETDGAKGSVRLMGEAKSLADVLAYVGRLGQVASLADPQLLSQESRQSDGQPVVAFAIEARWNTR